MRQKSLSVKSSKCDGDLATQYHHAKKLHVQAKFLSPMPMLIVLPIIYLLFWMLRHLVGDAHGIGMRFFNSMHYFSDFDQIIVRYRMLSCRPARRLLNSTLHCSKLFWACSSQSSTLELNFQCWTCFSKIWNPPINGLLIGIRGGYAQNKCSKHVE